MNRESAIEFEESQTNPGAVFLKVALTSGYTVHINPGFICALEPGANGGTQVVMGITAADEIDGKRVAFSYYTDEKPDDLYRRIFEAQNPPLAMN